MPATAPPPSLPLARRPSARGVRSARAAASAPRACRHRAPAAPAWLGPAPRRRRVSIAKPSTPLFRTAADGSTVPAIRAEAAIIYNPVTQQVLWEENSQNSRSIASITKVMTAVVFLEHALDLTTPVKIERSDVRAASTTYLRANDVLTPNDLLQPAAHRIRQRRRARAGAGLAVRHRRLHRADERQGPGARPRAHALRRSVRPDRAERLVGLRHGAPDCVRGRRRAHRQHHAQEQRADRHEHAARSTCTAPTSCCSAATSTSAAARPASSASPATAWRRCCRCPNGDPVAVVVLGARSNAGRFLEAKHLFNWMSERTRTLLSADGAAATQAAPQPQPE